MPTPAPTISAAVEGLSQRQNQIVLDGGVAGIMANGELAITAQGQRPFLCSAVIDHEFEVGQPVIIARDKGNQWSVIAVGNSGIEAAEARPLVTPPPIVSQSLHEAVLRAVERRNQILFPGSVGGILEDGSVATQLENGMPILSFAASTQEFEPGQTVKAMRQDDDSWILLGSI